MYRPDMYAKLKDGNVVPCLDIFDWAESFEESDRRIRLTEFNNVQVSTVFLGVNHNFISGGPPLWFETMIFSEDEHDGDTWRYSTLQQAIEGHNAVLQKVYGFKE